MKNTDLIHILGIAGSLRKGSYNKALLRTAAFLTPDNAKVEIFEQLRDIPLFDQDFEQNPVPAVITLKEKIKELVEALITWTSELKAGEKAIQTAQANGQYQQTYGSIVH